MSPPTTRRRSPRLSAPTILDDFEKDTIERIRDNDKTKHKVDSMSDEEIKAKYIDPGLEEDTVKEEREELTKTAAAMEKASEKLQNALIKVIASEDSKESVTFSGAKNEHLEELKISPKSVGALTDKHIARIAALITELNNESPETVVGLPEEDDRPTVSKEGSEGSKADTIGRRVKVRRKARSEPKADLAQPTSQSEEAKTLIKSFDPFWKREGHVLCANAEWIHGNTGTKSEARARAFIDHLAVPAARFCQKELSKDAFVLFEPNIADGDLQGKRGGPVEFPTRPGTGRGKTLSFTGRVDYVLSAGKLGVAPAKLTDARNLVEFWDRATAMSESDAPAGLLGLLAKEAKKLMPRKELLTHLPQVILETMAT
ncbi:hypothetical protein CC1G_15730 [Coprinopsis cinerea okayama7|uniref:Uncharacterized protein n=1 Tax=Coprinopsis cinerea (strain Okayama-7 / 130 / ATCC MYA-4618 / FGSC 9003) TaxID=240176 RepID=D6RQ89_COPC7|nr:hypothetical protein CC1G_15730 [Coprinopsis cinerea okayama7\|eukprot:XP_002910301.1 hypothetical protein CC1G_15730 [Coprinopsis cinerea okayama7\